MKNDFKLMAAAIIFTFLLVLGGSVLLGGEEKSQDPTTQVMGVAVNPENYQLGNVPIKAGIVTRDYEIENTTDQTIKIKKIATSCMCTQAKITINGQETKFFGMEHPTDKNPPINLELAPGEKALVTVNFDPAAHGPQGVGAFERVVWLTFSDPEGVKELTFSGVVVN